MSVLTLDQALDLAGADQLSDAQAWAFKSALITDPALRREWGQRLRSARKMAQLYWYRVMNPDALRVHLSTAREFGVQGGYKSGKTETLLAEAVIQMTGIVPFSLRGRYPPLKLRPPIHVRLVTTSLTTAWENNLKRKLQWWMWNGRQNEDGLEGDPDCGHWGWVPSALLINQDWNQSWSERHRVLTLSNGSTLSVMAHEQDEKEFNQGAFHLVLEDEIPPEHIHRANKGRVMEFGGQILTAGTPPDDRSAAVTAAWFFDQVLAPGFEGSNPEETDAVALWTEKNPVLAPADVAHVAKGLTEEQKQARLYGRTIHLSGLVIKGFTEKPRVWCFVCDGPVLVTDDRCQACGSGDLARYSHVWDEDDLAWPGPAAWPVLFYMDPHQARPTACAWYKVDPLDQWWQVAELEVAGNAGEVKRQVDALEAGQGWQPLWRKGDPKITAQTNQFANEFGGQIFSIKEAFTEVGFDFEEANTNFTVAKERIEGALRPNALTRAPRLRVHRSCVKSLYHLTHYVWDTRGRRENVDVKEKPSRHHSDFVALARYLAMDDPEWRTLQAVTRARTMDLTAGLTGRNAGTGW